VDKTAVLFDLGNTLVQYYTRAEFPAVLSEALDQVRRFLAERHVPLPPESEIQQRTVEENHEAADYRVRPLENRLRRIFQLEGESASEEILLSLCRRFLLPIFARARRCPDAVPVLRELRASGLKLAIVSNSPWGSPAALWREELERHGLAERVDAVVFCRDVGWRKPARPIFDHTRRLLQVEAAECVFVGDDPRWDVAGPAAAGIDAILLDPTGAPRDCVSVRSLAELPEVLRAWPTV